MKHRISAGALVIKSDKLLLARHYIPTKYDFWAPPGGGVEGDEELSQAAEREAFEETGIRVKAKRLAYIDELIDDSGRMVKFWYYCEYIDGEIDVQNNPASEEAITEAYWFAPDSFPSGHIFPTILRDAFWDDLTFSFNAPKLLPLQNRSFDQCEQ